MISPPVCWWVSTKRSSSRSSSAGRVPVQVGQAGGIECSTAAKVGQLRQERTPCRDEPADGFGQACPRPPAGACLVIDERACLRFEPVAPRASAGSASR